ncbi:replication initiator protein [Capybara microvirus Cap1_SP_95]|nr:replication initiator protein [Capybara microvirus Cap1_SP_95]
MVFEIAFMACVYPLRLRNVRSGLPLDVACGQCMNCRVQKTMSLSWLANMELYTRYRKGQSASFVTLTYDDSFLPRVVCSDGAVRPTLRKVDLQRFFKRVRKNLSDSGIKDNWSYIACGEHGDKFNRPHYHFVALGLSDSICDYSVRRAWRFGLTDTGVLRQGGLNYVCKYMTKAPTGRLAKELFTDLGLEKPFVQHSQNLGMQWILDNYRSLVENNYCYYDNGKLIPLPSALRRRLDIYKQYDDSIQIKRLKDSARQNGFGDSWQDYARIHAFNVEKMVIDSSRSSGVPQFDCDYSSADKIPIYNNHNVNVANVDYLTTECLDPVPF